MFDVGFSELMVIGLVALVVIGPEKLPRVARTVGLLLGRLQRHVADVKADINREIQLDEMKRLGSEMVESAREIEQSIQIQARAFEADMQGALNGARALPTEPGFPSEPEPGTGAGSAVEPAGVPVKPVPPRAAVVPPEPLSAHELEKIAADEAAPQDLQFDLFGAPVAPTEQTKT